MRLKNSHKILIFFFILLFRNHYTYAERDNILLNLQSGYHYDVGNLQSLNDSGINPQHSLSIGLSYKVDLSFFFMQLGLNKSILLSKGTISDNSADQLKSITINYYSAPMYCGLNFPLKEDIKLFIGAGICYFLTEGTIKTSTGPKTFDEIIFARVITLGVQYRVFEQIGVFIQWENISANTAPVADTDSANNWNNFEIDLTGNRTNFGISYYIK